MVAARFLAVVQAVSGPGAARTAGEAVLKAALAVRMYEMSLELVTFLGRVEEVSAEALAAFRRPCGSGRVDLPGREQPPQPRSAAAVRGPRERVSL